MSECTNISRCEQCKYLCFRSLSIILSVLRKGEWWNSLQLHAGSGWLKLKCEKCRKKWKLQLAAVYSVYSICCMHLDIFIGCWLLCRKKHALCSSAELHWLRSSVSSSWRLSHSCAVGPGSRQQCAVQLLRKAACIWRSGPLSLSQSFTWIAVTLICQWTWPAAVLFNDTLPVLKEVLMLKEFDTSPLLHCQLRLSFESPSVWHVWHCCNSVLQVG